MCFNIIVDQTANFQSLKVLLIIYVSTLRDISFLCLQIKITLLSRV